MFGVHGVGHLSRWRMGTSSMVRPCWRRVSVSAQRPSATSGRSGASWRPGGHGAPGQHGDDAGAGLLGQHDVVEGVGAPGPHARGDVAHLLGVAVADGPGLHRVGGRLDLLALDQIGRALRATCLPIPPKATPGAARARCARRRSPTWHRAPGRRPCAPAPSRAARCDGAGPTAAGRGGGRCRPAPRRGRPCSRGCRRRTRGAARRRRTAPRSGRPCRRRRCRWPRRSTESGWLAKMPTLRPPRRASAVIIERSPGPAELQHAAVVGEGGDELAHVVGPTPVVGHDGADRLPAGFGPGRRGYLLLAGRRTSGSGRRGGVDGGRFVLRHGRPRPDGQLLAVRPDRLDRTGSRRRPPSPWRLPIRRARARRSAGRTGRRGRHGRPGPDR